MKKAPLAPPETIPEYEIEILPPQPPPLDEAMRRIALLTGWLRHQRVNLTAEGQRQMDALQDDADALLMRCIGMIEGAERREVA